MTGGFLLGRSLALLVVWTLSTSMAARQGPVPMAAHQICRQLWFAAALLSDSLALAAQAIISTAFAQHDYKQAEDTAFLVLQVSTLSSTHFLSVHGELCYYLQFHTVTSA
jgi:Na+-driven multidrug efflux pump